MNYRIFLSLYCPEFANYRIIFLSLHYHEFSNYRIFSEASVSRIIELSNCFLRLHCPELSNFRIVFLSLHYHEFSNFRIIFLSLHYHEFSNYRIIFWVFIVPNLRIVELFSESLLSRICEFANFVFGPTEQREENSCFLDFLWKILIRKFDNSGQRTSIVTRLSNSIIRKFVTKNFYLKFVLKGQVSWQDYLIR